jgi:hypothetical protein
MKVHDVPAQGHHGFEFELVATDKGSAGSLCKKFAGKKFAGMSVRDDRSDERLNAISGQLSLRFLGSSLFDWGPQRPLLLSGFRGAGKGSPPLS